MYHHFICSIGIMAWLLVSPLPSLSAFQQVTADATSEVTQIRVEKDVAYLVEPAVQDDYRRQRCHLDWYLPVGIEGFPTVVWFHGGSLRAGEKDGEHEQAIARRFAQAGVGFVSVNYRLSPKAQFPAYVEDAAAAVAFVRKSVADKGGAPEHVFVSGHSAGGYLTLMVGLDPKYLKSHDLEPRDLAGFLPVAGQTITHSTVRAEKGIPEDQPVIDAGAPAYHVPFHQSVPIMCIAGGRDLPARSEENQYLVAMLKAHKHPQAEYHHYADRDHGSVAFGIPNEGDAVFTDMMEFIDGICEKTRR